MRLWQTVLRFRQEAAGWLRFYYFYFALLTVVLGIALAVILDQYIGFSAAWLPGLAGICGGLLLLALVFRRAGLLLPILLLLGFAWGGLAVARLAAFAVPVGEAVVFEGRVIEVLSQEEGYFDYLAMASGSSGYGFVIQGVDQNGWQGRLLVSGADVEIKPGDRLQLVGLVRSQTINYNFGVRESGYLQSRGIAAAVRAVPGSLSFRRLAVSYSLTNLGAGLRQRVFAAMSDLPPLQQALLKGMGFGHTETLGPGQRSVLQQTGIMHIFAVSGLHIGYVVLLAGCFVRRVGRLRLPFVLPRLLRRLLEFGGVLLPVLLFDAAAGFSPSVLRATLMALAVLICNLVGVEKHSGYALMIAAFLLLLKEPLWIRQPGFLFSFMAAGGIVFTARLWQRLVRWPLLAAACGAQFLVLPLSAYFFNTVSVIGLLISPLVVLAAGPVVMLLLLAILLLPFGLAGAPLAGAGLLAELIYRGAELGARLPGAFAYAAAPGLAAMLMYYGLVSLSLYFMARLGHDEQV